MSTTNNENTAANEAKATAKSWMANPWVKWGLVATAVVVVTAVAVPLIRKVSEPLADEIVEIAKEHSEPEA
ncbi:hypothetical protein pEaSNUABM54_00202 [Erwinia phage pEa_SNUABM_54]|nr:hypothetical protein pEaSNUABM54_00202 [Erwinia phage pEa_SNUABM_54]